MLKALRMDNGKSIIYGCGLIGRKILQVLQEENIPVIAWCDDNIQSSKKILNLRVYNRDECLEKFPEANIITAFTLPSRSAEFLKNNTDYNIFSGAELLSDQIFNVGGRLNLDQYSIWRSIAQYNGFYARQSSILSNMGVVITEKCSLKCKNCYVHSSRFPDPQHYPLSVLKSSMDNCLYYFDQLNFINIIGGEPFLHHEWDKYLSYLLDLPKVKTICLTTNGTVLPPETKLKVLANEKVLVYISGYNHVQEKAFKLCDLLDKHHVRYHKYDYADTPWIEIGKPIRHNRSEKQNQQHFQSCPFISCYALISEKIFRCTAAGNIFRLEHTELDGSLYKDYIDLNYLRSTKQDVNKGRNLIENYLLSNKPLVACDFCDIKPDGKQYITPGEQL